VRKALLLGVIAAGAAAVAAQWLPTAPMYSSSTSSDTPAPAAQSRAEGTAPERGLASLPARRPIGELRGELFAVPPSPTPRARVAAPEPPPKPVAPAMPYRVAGTVVHDGVSKVVLMKGDAVVTVEAGEMLEGGYRVESIDRNEIVMLYVPLGLRERLPVISTIGVDVEPETPLARAPSPLAQAASAGTSARPAQLRWEGPERVQAGNTFTVALKITSDEPLRSSPLQVSFDAKLLEPVAVRPGKFFGDGSFAYRVNAQGSIFVGASGPGNVAADAELLVLTFKPIRPAASTEVKISSLVLHGQVGKPIAIEPMSAYRTSIIP
jgi:hypothetical protein